MSDEVLASDIPVKIRGIGRLEQGSLAIVSYHPTRGKYGPKDRVGKITEVSTLNDGRVKFRFHDAGRERDIETTVGNTTGNSTIRSRKANRWTTLGTPLRGSVSRNAENVNQFLRETGGEFFEGRHESVVFAAAIEWNDRILDWLDWSEKHA